MDTQAVKDITLELDHPSLTIYAIADEVPSVNVWGAERKSGLFQDAFGLDLRFQWRPTSENTPDAAAPAREDHVEAG